jgi:hypothetical protein
MADTIGVQSEIVICSNRNFHVVPHYNVQSHHDVAASVHQIVEVRKGWLRAGQGDLFGGESVIRSVNVERFKPEVWNVIGRSRRTAEEGNWRMRGADSKAGGAEFAT